MPIRSNMTVPQRMALYPQQRRYLSSEPHEPPPPPATTPTPKKKPHRSLYTPPETPDGDAYITIYPHHVRNAAIFLISVACTSPVWLPPVIWFNVSKSPSPWVVRTLLHQAITGDMTNPTESWYFTIFKTYWKMFSPFYNWLTSRHCPQSLLPHSSDLNDDTTIASHTLTDASHGEMNITHSDDTTTDMEPDISQWHPSKRYRKRLTALLELFHDHSIPSYFSMMYHRVAINTIRLLTLLRLEVTTPSTSPWAQYYHYMIQTLQSTQKQRSSSRSSKANTQSTDNELFNALTNPAIITQLNGIADDIPQSNYQFGLLYECIVLHALRLYLYPFYIRSISALEPRPMAPLEVFEAARAQQEHLDSLPGSDLNLLNRKHIKAPSNPCLFTPQTFNHETNGLMCCINQLVDLVSSQPSSPTAGKSGTVGVTTLPDAQVKQLYSQFMSSVWQLMPINHVPFPNASPYVQTMINSGLHRPLYNAMKFSLTRITPPPENAIPLPNYPSHDTMSQNHSNTKIAPVIPPTTRGQLLTQVEELKHDITIPRILDHVYVYDEAMLGSQQLATMMMYIDIIIRQNIDAIQATIELDDCSTPSNK